MMCKKVLKMRFLWIVTVGLVLVGVSGRENYERIGYFWHITDIHYDGHYSSYSDIRKGCWRPDYDGNAGQRAQRKPLGLYGDYSCDATWELIDSAAKMMMSQQNEKVDFVLWTGDALSHHATRHLKRDRQLEMVQNVTDLLRKTFSSQFVFPALGHEDPNAREELGKMWSVWLPTDALKTFATGGYYIIERKAHKLQIVVINTNLMKQEDDEEAEKQWSWLEEKFEKLRTNGLKVYVVGHIPPGSDERHKGISTPSHIMYKDHHNKKYLNFVRRYHDVIVGQFFGHLHSDTFRVIYDGAEKGRPISWAMLAPSITPKRTHDGPNNPGLRIYKFDKDTGQVFDYTQYYLDLSTANYNGKADWVVEYNFSTYYGFNVITPSNLHSLADKFTQETNGDNSVFNKYYKANSVKIHNRASANCDETCAHTHYCAITRIDYDEHSQCIKVAASALSSSSSFLLLGAKVKLISVGILGLVRNIIVMKLIGGACFALL